MVIMSYEKAYENIIARKSLGQLTQHFSWGEFLKDTQEELAFYVSSGELTPAKLANIEQLAKRLEGVRKELGGRPITITSGWRSEKRNKAAGGASKSQHLLGRAADIVVAGMTPKAVQAKLESTWTGGMGYGATFTHLDTRIQKVRFSYG